MPPASLPPKPGRASQPEAFERRRLLEAAREHTRLILVVGLLALFGGALVARLSVPLDVRAQASAALPTEPASPAREHALGDAELARARDLSGVRDDVAALRRSVELSYRDGHAVVAVHASDESAALRLADSLVTALVTNENARHEAERERKLRVLDGELEKARAERERADAARAQVLTREHLAAPEEQASALRERITQLDAQIVEARARASEATARGSVLASASRSDDAKHASAELSEAQRALSVLLAGQSEEAPEVFALRQRISVLQARTVTPASTAVGRRAEARAEAARALLLERERAKTEGELERLATVLAELAPVSEARAQANDRVVMLEAQRADLDALQSRAEVLSRASVVSIEGRGARLAVALTSPFIAIALVLLLLFAREVRDFRVCTAAELAHWLELPVVASSAWPRNEAALEALVDELFDASVDSAGTMLVLPMSELERPLAHTLAARLNARAQRQFRSVTGARIAIAQAWEGELGGSRSNRAAEVADRVLWVVVADHYRGRELEMRRTLLERKHGVAAVLVDAPARALARTIGDTQSFWAARSESQAAAQSVPPARVPLH